MGAIGQWAAALLAAGAVWGAPGTEFSFDKSPNAVGGGVRGRALGRGEAAKIALGKGLPWTVSGCFRVDRYPDAGEGRWDGESPMTVLRLTAADEPDAALFLRLHRRKLLATQFRRGKESMECAGRSTVEPGRWYFFSVGTDGAGRLRLFLNGRPEAETRRMDAEPAWTRIDWMNAGGRRRLVGALDECAAVAAATDDREAAKRYRRVMPAKLHFELPAPPPPLPERRFPALQVASGQLHPLIDQLHISATLLPGTRDLLVQGLPNSCGRRVAIHRMVGMRDGLPVYDGGTTVPGVTGQGFQAVARPDGGCDLYALGRDTAFGRNNLVRLRGTGGGPLPTFAAPELATLDGKAVSEALAGALTGWTIADVDRDGTPDLLLSRVHPADRPSSLPYTGSPWTGKPQPDAGPDRGYDLDGRWLGAPTLTEIGWARGTWTADGGLQFSAYRPFWDRVAGYSLKWSGHGAGRALQLLSTGDRRWLLLAGNVDVLLALPLEERGGEFFCGRARPLLATGRELPHTYYPWRIEAVDLDGDGRVELLVDGNPGRVVVLKGDRVGAFREIGSVLRDGGALAADTLVSPCRIDWDGDGRPDLLTGDASGYLVFWPGSDDPLVYGAPRPMRTAAGEIHHQAGYSGSIQGPTEKRWGYLKVTAGGWRDAGDPAIIVNDIHGVLTLYRPAGGGDPAELAAPAVFTLNGRPFRAAWRSRPDLLPAKYGFGGRRYPLLLIQDFDGDAAVAIPAEPGGTDLQSVEKLRYADGSAVRLCGPVGLWGRAALTVCDWDGDGRWDMLVGTNAACQRFFDPEAGARSGATPYWLRNIGSNAEPVFAPARPLVLADGGSPALGKHNATPWPTDLDGDGREDLLIGAEDGKVYVLMRNDFAAP